VHPLRLVQPLRVATAREVPWGLALTASFALVTLLFLGPLQPVDVELNRPWRQSWPELRETVRLVVRLGQRAVGLPILFAVAFYAARQVRCWRPVVLSVVAVLTLNVAVGLLKLSTGRETPRTGDPDFFQSGIIYPSGHSANAVLVYGLAAYLAYRFLPDRPVLARGLLVLTIAVSVAIPVGSLYLQTHWLSDLVAGWLVGGAVLASAVRERGALHRLTALIMQEGKRRTSRGGRR